MKIAERSEQLVVLEQQLAIGRLLQSLVEVAARAEGLSEREGRVLVRIGRARRDVGVLSVEICRDSGISAPHVSRAVKALHARGLIIVPEVGHGKDGRKKLLFLSTKGRRVYSRVQHRLLPMEEHLRHTLGRLRGERSRNLDQLRDRLTQPEMLGRLRVRSVGW
jgi:DNA-binding MarR family transcriptional regulator